MKKMPIAVGMMVFGVMWVVLGAANGWVAITTAASIATFGGFVWFCLIWDKLMKLLIPLKHYDKRVRKLEDKCKDYAESRNYRDKSVDNKINALQKRGSQNVKGQVIQIIRKEA